MANLQWYSYDGFGEWAKKNLHYSQAVRVGDRIICSGQATFVLTEHLPCGWDARQKESSLDTLVKDNLSDEIDQAFANCDYNLKHAGGKGWSQVYRIVTYSTDVASQHERIQHNMRKWMPDHNPIWTELGVGHLGSDKMHFEIDVEAYDEEGAAEARKSR